MRLNYEAKNMLAVMALVGALALALNDAAAGGGDRDLLSWSLALFVIAIVFWIWLRRDAAADADQASAEAPADDLTRINGIGPIYAEALRQANIDSFAQLAAMSSDELAQVFADAEVNRPKSLESWIEQAAFAARGDWDGLSAYQDAI